MARNAMRQQQQRRVLVRTAGAKVGTQDGIEGARSTSQNPMSHRPFPAQHNESKRKMHRMERRHCCEELLTVEVMRVLLLQQVVA
jgi:hypothetical protein